MVRSVKLVFRAAHFQSIFCFDCMTQVLDPKSEIEGLKLKTVSVTALSATASLNYMHQFSLIVYFDLGQLQTDSKFNLQSEKKIPTKTQNFFFSPKNSKFDRRQRFCLDVIAGAISCLEPCSAQQLELEQEAALASALVFATKERTLETLLRHAELWTVL